LPSPSEKRRAKNRGLCLSQTLLDRGDSHMKKLIILIGLWLVVCLLVAVSCAQESAVPEPTPTPTPAPTPAPTPEPEILLPPLPPGVEPSDVVPAPAPVEPSQIPVTEEGALETMPELGEAWATRMIVRTAEISLVVDDVAVVLDQVAELAEGFGGYVVSSTRWKEEERLVGIITIRVPAEDFDDTMEALRGLAVEVTHEDTSAQDVTEEYIDLSARLHNLEVTEEQLLRLMEKAEKVEDMLNIQRELSNTRGEIEQTKGRMQYLELTSATSLIRVQLNEAELDVTFSADENRVDEGEKVEFEPRVSGGFPPYSYEWDFGDGESSTSVYPTHAYESAGSYTVSLEVTDDSGNTGVRTRDGYIVVRPGWSPGSIASAAWDGLVAFGRVLADIFIWIGIFSPVWIVGGGIYYWRRRRKRRA
jgi:hypothetical protein